MTRVRLRLGTRRSALALAQSTAVAGAVQVCCGRPVDLVEVVTHGDVDPGALAQIGGTGVFVTALRQALLAGEVDLAVHSLKDLPVDAPAGLTLAAVPQREDPRDALVCPAGLTLGELAPGARIGTGSPRRAAQLHALGLGLDVVPVRGNVDTRIALATRGELDAVVLARAGLARLDRLADVTEVLDPLQMLPAPGQGALGVECRSEDRELVACLARLDHPASRAATAAERAVLAALGAGCSAPVGALADVADAQLEGAAELYLRAVVVAPDGAAAIRRSATGPLVDADGLGRALAQQLLDEGASTLMGTG